jgi:hypothetical protein
MRTRAASLLLTILEVTGGFVERVGELMGGAWVEVAEEGGNERMASAGGAYRGVCGSSF